MGELRAHQRQPAADLLHILRSSNAVDFSDTGTGKTAVACWCAKQLGRPTLAVVPKISQSDWHRMAKNFDDEISVVGYESLRTGRTPYGSWQNNPPPGFRNETWFRCTVCQCVVDMTRPQRCPHHSLGTHCLEIKKKPWRYGQFTFHPGIGFVIFDEAHRCGAIKSLNAELLVSARRQGVRTLCLSATPAAGPLGMRALGYAINLHSNVNFYQWSRRYGCGKIPGLRGWHWKCGAVQKKVYMALLHAEIFPEHGIRIRRADIPGFPERVIEAKLFDLDEHDKVNQIYAQMKTETDALAQRAQFDKDPNLALTIQLRFREKIDLLKVPIAVELATDLIAKGNSVGIFCNFTSVLDELSRRLKCEHIIDGATGRKLKRETVISDFQADTARLVLLNSEAGGISVSLHDVRGEFPREGLVFSPLSARTFEQLTGRFQRDGGKSLCRYTVMLAADTAEEKIYQKLKIKLAHSAALLDSDFTI